MQSKSIDKVCIQKLIKSQTCIKIIVINQAREFAILLHFFPIVRGSLQDVVLAERTGGVDIEPLVYASAMKMMPTWEFP
jgi:hypothetical protein